MYFFIYIYIHMVDAYDINDPAMRGTNIFILVVCSVLLFGMIIAGIVQAVQERSQAKRPILHQQTLPQMWKTQPAMGAWTYK